MSICIYTFVRTLYVDDELNKLRRLNDMITGKEKP